MLLGLSALGCRASVGSSCEKGELRCAAPDRALACEQEKFIEVPCRGKGGCQGDRDNTVCDVGGNKAGDRCSLDDEGTAVCADGQNLLSCRKGKYTRVPCRGPSGCLLEGRSAACDQSVGVAGDPCREGDKKSCSVDRASVLECRDGTLSALYSCRGERGCVALGGRLDCDMTLAVEGDACGTKQEGHIACSGDRSSTLVCKQGRFMLDEKCAAKKTCVVEANVTRCAEPEKP